MQHITITCDICSHTIETRGWESAPTKVNIIYSAPQQQGESREFEHVCYDCVKGLQKAVFSFLQTKKK